MAGGEQDMVGPELFMLWLEQPDSFEIVKGLQAQHTSNGSDFHSIRARRKNGISEGVRKSNRRTSGIEVCTVCPKLLFALN